MVEVAQLVEHRVVVPRVVGSIPIFHPSLRLRGLDFEEFLWLRLADASLPRPLVRRNSSLSAKSGEASWRRRKDGTAYLLFPKK
jgi:hypothetical protein